MKFIAPLVLATLLPMTAFAEGFSTEDLNGVADDPTCIARAVEVFEEYAARNGRSNIVSGNWTITSFDIGNNEDMDAIVTCNYGPNNTTRATLVVHSQTDETDAYRANVAGSIRAMWDLRGG